MTPEATRPLLQKPAVGLVVAMLSYGLQVNCLAVKLFQLLCCDGICPQKLPAAMLSRPEAGVRGNTLIVNLPGSTGGVKDGIQV